MSTAKPNWFFLCIVQCFVSGFLENKRINTILLHLFVFVIPDVWILWIIIIKEGLKFRKQEGKHT